ncbi:SGNH/GDSL hydrolase family protein [Tenacibaculum sp. TC6]|uniref:SGNH/GDSL hydrolase family protein n=1 Tax=Tenacibaculum sp. TC6 TaxID=3423223 RepID=UPI003D365369
MKKLLFLLLLVPVIAFTQPHSKTEISILFIGNSLTYYNDLPKLVAKEAKKKGIKIRTKTVAYPNYAIVDHWNGGTVQKLIASKAYKYVIIQQGPSSQNEGRQMLIEAGKKYRQLCHKNGATLCYFMVWPSLTYYATFDGVIKNYTDAARLNEAILLPVGKAWKNYFDTTNTFDYYGKDGFHPSLKGSKAAANSIVKHLFKENHAK